MGGRQRKAEEEGLDSTSKNHRHLAFINPILSVFISFTTHTHILHVVVKGKLLPFYGRFYLKLYTAMLTYFIYSHKYASMLKLSISF